MIRSCDWKTTRYRPKDGVCRHALPVILVAAIAFPAVSNAATIDWNVASGNWNVNTNWIDYSTNLSPALPPGAIDDAHLRNAGTATLSDAESALSLNLGFARNVELDPVGMPGVLTDLGLDGALKMTAGSLTAGQIFIGKAHNGVVTQSGGDIAATSSTQFDLGDGGSTNLGTGTYTMTGGTITMQGGTNGNNGIEVINGTFNMQGGTINQTGGTVQRTFRIGTKNATTSTVNITGGTINAPTGGIRIGDGGTSTGVLNVNQNDGTTNIFVGGDLAVGRSTASLGKMNMSAGTVTIGTLSATARLQAGNAGPGQIVMTGGSMEAFNTLRLGQAPAAQGSFFNLLGGTVTTRGFDSRTDAAIGSIPETTGSRFTIDGGTYISLGTNAMDIGQKGRILVELKSGSASVAGSIQMGSTVDSKATLSISGGTFTLGTNLLRNTVTGNDVFGNPMTAPVINLTGGQLVLNSAATPVLWQADFNNQGTEIVEKTGAVYQTTVGDATHPGNFSMSSGIWDIDINGHALTSADRFVVSSTGGIGSLTGGTLKLNYLSGFTPSLGDSIPIVQAAGGGVTLNPAAVTIVAPVSPDGAWSVQTVGTDIRLVFAVPEPASLSLMILGLLAGMVRLRPRS